MARDPRSFIVKDRACEAKDAPAETGRRDFFRTLGKIGDLEVLNKIDNDIGKGLRTLAGISENVRNKAGPVPSIIRQTGEQILDAGADFVLNSVGVDARNTRLNGIRFSPQVANRALGQAEAIYDAIREGRLDDYEDIPQAIADFSNMEILLRSIFTGDARRPPKFKNQCVSPYARDLIERAPKHKFMFVVEIVLNEPYASDPVFGKLSEQLAFVVKRSTRPNISFDYEEVNFYNFRSKILKRHEYQPMTMSFYDDHRGRAITFWNQYLQAVSPLSRGDASQTINAALLEANSMSFGSNLSSGTTSLRNPGNAQPTPTTVINHIKLYHVYRGGSKFDEYIFVAPKITELQLDELDMAQSGDGSELSLSFVYDQLIMSAGVDMDQATSDNISALTDAGLYALRPPVIAGAPPQSEFNIPENILNDVDFGINVDDILLT